MMVMIVFIVETNGATREKFYGDMSKQMVLWKS
jgi:hypothetical protein